MDVITSYGIPGFREPVSCLTHLLAVPVFLGMGVLLLRRGRGSWGRWLSLLTLVVTTVFLLAMSSVYHMLPNGTGRYVMKQLDVAGVFALIAGTATPLHAILFRGPARWLTLAVVWAIAAVGITLRAVFFDRLPPGLGSGVFLLMGWGGAVSCAVLWRRQGYRFIAPLLWGGVAYTVGVLVLTFNAPTVLPGVIGPHELWHVAVLVGLGLHWVFTFGFASGAPPDPEEASAAPACRSA